MMYRFVSPGHVKDTMGRKSLDRENPARGAISCRKHNRCVICPATVIMVAEALERRNHNWIVRAKVKSDLIIQIGASSFHLHKLPLVARSGYLNRLVFQRRTNGERDSSFNIQIDNFPGGAKIFELVVKFCYGWKVDLTAANIAPLYCAAHFLEMSDDLEQGNLISKTEAFLSFLIFSSWKDTFQILKSCESISSWAKELQILKRCSEAIAWKACTNPEAVSFGSDDAQCLNVLGGNTENSKLDGIVNNWWFEDVSILRIDHFIQVIESIKRKGMRPEHIGSCIAHWTTKWFSRITFGLDNLSSKSLSNQLQRVTTECLVKALPKEENSVSCNFLLHLLKVGLIMKIDSDLLNNLETRIAFMLEKCHIRDLLVNNYGDNDTAYDVEIVIRVVKSYVSVVLRNPQPRIFVVGRLVDAYLSLVASDAKLSVRKFQSLADTLPKNARYCDDNLYRAIDMYLKSHPSLTEEERVIVCKSMDHHKLSQEARQHAMKNDRLPLNITTRLILVEQVNMTRSMTTIGSSYRRTKTQAIIRVSKGLEKGGMNFQELKMMKKDVETMKVQLDELQMCKLKLQRKVQRCII